MDGRSTLVTGIIFFQARRQARGGLGFGPREEEAGRLLDLENSMREQRRCSLYSLESKKKRKNSSNSIYKIHSTRRLSRFTVRVFLNTRRKSRRDRFEIAFKAHKELFSTVSFDRSRSTREAKEEKEEERKFIFLSFVKRHSRIEWCPLGIPRLDSPDRCLVHGRPIPPFR